MNSIDNLVHSACPCCSSPIARWREKETSIDMYALDRCTTCGYTFVNPRPSLDFLMEYYEQSGHAPGDKELQANHPSLKEVESVESHFPNSTLDASRILKTFTKLLPDPCNRTFLDVGCGYGFFSKAAQEAGFEVSMLELAEHEREIARQMTGIAAAASSFEQYSCQDKSFDAILMSQILEHTFDVNEWIGKAYRLAKPNGVICVAVPNFNSFLRYLMAENEPFIIPPTHLNFFSVESLSLLMEKHGFRVETTQHISRISAAKLRLKLPSPLRFASPIINGSVKMAFAAFDMIKLGMIINVYGRKL